LFLSKYTYFDLSANLEFLYRGVKLKTVTGAKS
jgi:hypothetical protein